MERISNSKTVLENNINLISVVEKSANYEGNWSQLLFERMNNSVIKQQLIDLLYKKQLAEEEYYRTEPFSFHNTKANGDAILKNHAEEKVLGQKIKTFLPKTKEKLQKELNKKIAKAISSTHITFSDKEPWAKEISLFYKNPYTGEKLTTKQMSMIEAHEKGHNIRNLVDPMNKFYQQYFARGFDPSQIVFTEEDFKVLRSGYNKDLRPKEEIFEKTKINLIIYLFSANEIMERMSQLKNYFGMCGDEKFTKTHLAYAKQHYLKDLGFDNWMSHLFQAIKPETEEYFLWLINNSGI